jgi:hypothetical protein
MRSTVEAGEELSRVSSAPAPAAQGACAGNVAKLASRALPTNELRGRPAIRRRNVAWAQIRARSNAGGRQRV